MSLPQYYDMAQWTRIDRRRLPATPDSLHYFRHTAHIDAAQIDQSLTAGNQLIFEPHREVDSSIWLQKF